MHRAAVAAVLTLVLVPRAACAEDESTFAIVFHVGADATGVPVASERSIADSIARANQLFAPAGIAFCLHSLRALPAGSATLTSIRARHRLARRLVDRRINVFVVARIDDPHPSRTTRLAAAQQGRALSGRLGGAHIRVRGHRPPTYIIVTAHDDGTSLAHELGHFFGAPHHADPTNVMSYGIVRERFDERQLRVFGMFARRYRRDGLSTAPPGRRGRGEALNGG